MARRLEVVIDSSVAVKWFSEEKKTAEALRLRDNHVEGRILLVSTSLLTCEVANALRYKPDYNTQKLQEAIRHLFKLSLLEEPIDNKLLSLSSEVAFEADLTIYDAIPVALAALKKTRCITADHTQYARLRTKGHPIEIL